MQVSEGLFEASPVGSCRVPPCAARSHLRRPPMPPLTLPSRPQICPIPSSLASEAESTFLTQGAKFNYDFEEIAEPSTFHARAEQDGKGTEYFKVDLPDGKSLVHWLKPGTPFSLQFGRCVSTSSVLPFTHSAMNETDGLRC